MDVEFDDTRRMRSVAHDLLLEEICVRYPWLRLWMAQAQNSSYCLVIVKPSNVRDEYHRVVHDHELRERARRIIDPQRTNEPGDNAVLIIAPSH